MCKIQKEIARTQETRGKWAAGWNENTDSLTIFNSAELNPRHQAKKTAKKAVEEAPKMAKKGHKKKES